MSQLYKKQPYQTRWVSFENPNGDKGRGGRENQGAKGHAFDSLQPGETKVLLHVEGQSGIIQRIWLTLNKRLPHQLRAYRLDIYWDGEKKPAVSAPLGDFFCVGMGMVPFENALFASPEGRSLIATVPMPFHTEAKVTLTNESDEPISHFYYDINYQLVDALDKDALYFHANWRRQPAGELGTDFEVLPYVQGNGRFLGASVNVITDPSYEDTWWGSGEVKIYLDGDDQYPTLVGTGTDDYVGTGWGMGTYSQQNQGCLVSDRQQGWYSFYRLHLPDPVYFQEDCQVILQQMGSVSQSKLPRLITQGAKVQVVCADGGGRRYFRKILDMGTDIEDTSISDQFTCTFYRQDDWSAVAYFYLDTPSTHRPGLATVEERVDGMTRSEAKIDRPSTIKPSYVPKSLRPKEDGFAFNLHNHDETFTVIKLKKLQVDGRFISNHDITLVTMNGNPIASNRISEQTPVTFYGGTTLRVQVAGHELPHDLTAPITVAFQVRESPSTVQIHVQ